MITTYHIQPSEEKKLTKREKRSEAFGKWLDTVIESEFIKQNYPKLEGTGVEFFQFIFKDITVLHNAITPEVLKDIPEDARKKYIKHIQGQIAFVYRIDNGVTTSPVIYPPFPKLIKDHGYDYGYKIFDYINDWVKTKVNWTFKK